jgi:streptomycin 6-kinase
MLLPDIFIQNILGTLKDKAPQWLNELPYTVQLISAQWQLHNVRTMPNLSYNYVARAHSKIYAKTVILKICSSNKVFSNELTALRYFNGVGCVKLLDCNEKYNALLLEYIEPGIDLASCWNQFDESYIRQTILDILKTMHHTPWYSNRKMPTINEWIISLTKFTLSPLPLHYLKKATDLANTLVESQNEQYFLHGDLHFKNILKDHQHKWISIDPKGVVGELAYETAFLICSPLPYLLQLPNPSSLIIQRIEYCANALNIDPQRIIKWCYVQAILAACWAIEDQTDWKQWLSWAECIENLPTIKHAN